MLNNLFGGSGAEVYITVSPSCGLELMEVDKSGNIKSYAHTALAYNEAQREIADYNEFKSALESLLQMYSNSLVRFKRRTTPTIG